ncbi:hypothetical protein DSM3645_03518 [Blastopirellula marina DSM 3645]|uniref:Uncharacterized protein n=1 Tax=Blastopirellula marina DSM 3645 TaxID=314230 RepID=A3ZW17_9BACT|nr:hypothetical protein DSM3645_03518 [Blastopirellula marina DSM 3645]
MARMLVKVIPCAAKRSKWGVATSDL